MGDTDGGPLPERTYRVRGTYDGASFVFGLVIGSTSTVLGFILLLIANS